MITSNWHLNMFKENHRNGFLVNMVLNDLKKDEEANISVLGSNNLEINFEQNSEYVRTGENIQTLTRQTMIRYIETTHSDTDLSSLAYAYYQFILKTTEKGLLYILYKTKNNDDVEDYKRKIKDLALYRTITRICKWYSQIHDIILPEPKYSNSFIISFVNILTSELQNVYSTGANS